METADYKNRCMDLLRDFESDNGNSDEILREFRHLVYAFDSNLPLNAELDSPGNQMLFRQYNGKYSIEGGYDKIVGYMNFFIHYLEDYCTK